MTDDKDPPPKIPPHEIRPDDAVSATVITTAKLSTLRKLAQSNLQGAARFCALVRAGEAAHAGKQFDLGFFSEIQDNFDACIMLAGAALDANVNEMMEEERREKRIRFPDEEAFRHWLRNDVLTKYSRIAVMLGMPKITGDVSYKNAQKFLQLRNALVHYYPEWSGEPSKHMDLEADLPKLQTSPFLPESNPFFPL